MSIVVKISNDNMEATVELERQSESPLHVEAIKRALAEAGVLHGIDETACGHLVESAGSVPSGGQLSQRVALGTPSIDGEDGRIEMLVEYHRDGAGQVQDFGKIDFHDRGAFTPIEKDQLIANIVLPTPGTPGRNVRGAEIKPHPGKPARFRAGQGTTVIDKTQLRAIRAGDLRCIDELVEVMDTIKVSGNLNFEVGNIDCEGKVRIDGDVLPGFHIHATGDVQIFGLVDAAEINSQGTVVINQGVLRGSRIYAKQGIMVGYVRESYLESEGNIKIVYEAVNSTIVSADTISVSSNGSVVGGSLLARNNIEVGTAGHARGVSTYLAAGVSPLDELRAAKLKLDIHRASKREAVVDRMKDLAKPEHHPALDKLVSHHAAKRDQQLEALTTLQQNPVAYSDSRIKANTAVHSGVHIRIGRAETLIKRELGQTTFYYDADSGEVVGIKPKGKP